VFFISCVQGAVIDLAVEFTLGNQFGVSAIAGIATVAVGTIYYLALDGPSNNHLAPIGVPTTH
jgi:hypothetical protein